MCDFNAETSLGYMKCDFDGVGFITDNECNDNGSRLKSFCRSEKLCMASTYFNHPREQRYTWYSPDQRTKKKLDYVLTAKYIQQYITECVVDLNADLDTDHRLLVTSLNTPENKSCKKKRKSQ